jgi:hypothetical protein
MYNLCVGKFTVFVVEPIKEFTSTTDEEWASTVEALNPQRNTHSLCLDVLKTVKVMKRPKFRAKNKSHKM